MVAVLADLEYATRDCFEGAADDDLGEGRAMFFEVRAFDDGGEMDICGV